MDGIRNSHNLILPRIFLIKAFFRSVIDHKRKGPLSYIWWNEKWNLIDSEVIEVCIISESII